ncbi:MAG TPA: IPT/TIG domain-containing protein [Candidatus Saccharimonadales bacterium]|jgi:hypothetical protein|nr:IPT/TIG domain-containing protein [Candidatus Saccharimonadales bacterium]
MKQTQYIIALACLLMLCAGRGFSQLQAPVPPVNIIIDSDMAPSVDDVGDHAVMWGLANRGEVNVLAEICSSANDFSAPLMHAIATYYGHPNVPIGAHKGTTPNLENSATSNFAQQMAARFGIPNDTRANYPDAVTVYRQALAGAADHSVYIVADGYWQPLQALLQSPADSISPLTGIQLVTQKVVRLVPGAGFFPNGNEHNMRVDADAASFVYAHWPVQIVNMGVEVSQDVLTGPDFSSSTTSDPIKASYIQFNGGNPVPGFGQMPLLFAVRGLGTNFTVPGLNGQTTVENFSQATPGQNNWFQTPNVGDSYLAKQATAAQLEAILTPLLQSSTNLPMIRSLSPASLPSGSSAQTVTVNGVNFFADSQAAIGGSNRTTVLVSSTQINVQLTSSDLAQAGTLVLTVSNPSEGAWQSSPANFTVTGSATPPVLSSISPTSVTAGGPAFTLTATGSNFVNGASVRVGGSNRTTTFVSGSQLNASIPASDIASPGTLAVTVANPDGSTSAAITLTVNSPNNPVPVLASISPTSVPVGSGGFTLTATGSNFVSGAVVQVNGSSRTTTFVSGTQLSADIPAGDDAAAGSLSIAVVNPGPGGGTSSSVTLTVTNSAPVLSSISPANVTAGSGGFTLTVNGSNFISGAVVQVNGSSRTTTFVSGTQLSAAIPAGDDAAAGSLSITVVNPGSGGGTSSAVTLTVTNPLPVLSSISPASVPAGSGGFTLIVNGSNFVSGAVVQVNGSSRTTTFVSGTQLSAAIPAGDDASTGSLSITVVNPGPGGGASSAVTLTVTNPLPVLSSISPASIPAGSGGFTLTVNGSNFISGDVVQVNGSSRTTTFVSGTQLSAAIPAGDDAAAGSLSITVVNPGPGGGTSSSVTLTVINPLPVLSSISPASVPAGSGGFTLTVNGSNFVSGAVVQIDGASRTTTFISDTALNAAITSTDVAAAGTHSITVVNPGPGGGNSAAAVLTVIPPPVLSSISPASVIAGSAGFTLTANGSNFVSGAVVQVNGSTRTTTFVSGTQLQASISAADVASAGSLSIAVANPGSVGGGVSGTLVLAVNNPVPSISNISPSTALVLGSSFTLTVHGTGFISTSVVQVNGSVRPTTFVSSTQLKAQISNNDILSVGQRTITVVNPAPGGGVSNGATLTVVGLLGDLQAPTLERPTQVAEARPFFAMLS